MASVVLVALACLGACAATPALTRTTTSDFEGTDLHLDATPDRFAGRHGDLLGDHPDSPTSPALRNRSGGQHPSTHPATRHMASGRRAAPTVAHRILANGVRVVVWRDERAPVVAVRALWRGGLLVENFRQNGIGRFLARMFTASCGGGVFGISGRDSLGLRAEWPAHDWERGLAVVARCVLSPAFDHDDVGDQRARLIDESIERDADLDWSAFGEFARTLYRAHPYRMNAGGAVDSLSAIGRRELLTHYRRYYSVSGLTLAIVGNIEPDAALARVEALFGDAPVRPTSLAARPGETFTGRPARSREVFRYIQRDSARLVIGFPGTTWKSRDRHTLEVAAAILEARLAGALRRNTPARSSMVRSVPGIDPGYVIARIACRPDALPAVHEVARAELTALAATVATTGEVEKAQKSLLATRERALGDPGAVAAGIAFHEAHGLGTAAYLDYEAAIGRVRPADVMAAVARYLAWDRAVVATVAPLAASPQAQRRMRGIRKRPPRRRTRNRAVSQSGSQPGSRPETRPRYHSEGRRNPPEFTTAHSQRSR